MRQELKEFDAHVNNVAIEEWRAVPNLDGYEASSLGRIRSLDRHLSLVGRWGQMTRFHRGRVLRLKPKPNGWGAIYWCFGAGGSAYPQVNRIVCLTFNGEPPTTKHEAAHLDGNTDNNRPDNLAWKTATENAADKVRHGTAPIGIKNAMARLTPDGVIDILARYASGETSAALGAEYLVSVANVLMITRGDTWAHVPSLHRLAAKNRAKQNMIEAPTRRNKPRTENARA